MFKSLINFIRNILFDKKIECCEKATILDIDRRRRRDDYGIPTISIKKNERYVLVTYKNNTQTMNILNPWDITYDTYGSAYLEAVGDSIKVVRRIASDRNITGNICVDDDQNENTFVISFANNTD